jgi:ankyrin repeat protein
MAYRLQSRIALVSLVVSFLVATQGLGGELHQLLKYGEIEKAKALLKQDPELKDSRDDMKRTPLHYAAKLGQLEVAKLLLELKADVNARAYNNFTPLHLAQDPAMVQLLIANKADLEAKSAGWAPLQHATYNKSTENWRTIAKILIDAGAYYDIYSAVSLDDLNRVKALLKEDPKKALDKALMRHAVQIGRTTVVKLLLDSKADPKDSGDGGLPVLYYALEHPDVVRVLLQAGADPKVRLFYHGNHTGMAPDGEMLLHYAVKMGQVETAKLLIQAGADVNCRIEGNNVTPLMWAASGVQTEMVKFSLASGADVNATDDQGRTPLAWADKSNKEMIELLKKHGGK